MPLEMLMGCRDDGGFSFQLCGVKQEQDLFLRFSIKKAVDSLEKVAIVPILDMLARSLGVLIPFLAKNESAFENLAQTMSTWWLLARQGCDRSLECRV
ncbi:TPA: hypothetical protein NG591_003511 [Vibrio parahaemolyticus]|nr:hypothetical protein [Vibrio parahaemolyticus]MBE5170997.1 hypothetical protein [Vibrio parahaemolyticus]HCE3385999.1 hypothetical protein [Vibrio parahaemolyticus]